VTDSQERTTSSSQEETSGGENGSQATEDFSDLDSCLVMDFLDADRSDDREEASEGEAGHDERLGRIKQSHALLSQFTPKELKILKSLKRNTSPKAWTLREDLVVLTLNLSNREIADLLTDRNKEAVKKRLQLLRSKGLTKRPIDPSPPASSV
jgi:hypothetical protein